MYPCFNVQFDKIFLLLLISFSSLFFEVDSVNPRKAGKLQFVDELILSDEAKLNPTIETNPRTAIPAEAAIVLFSKNARKSNNIFNNLKTARVQLSCGQIKQFVDGHNVRRQRVARGVVPRQPTAANMIYMVWDEELAEKATRWAENGIFGHNPNRTVGSQRWNLVGENVFVNILPRPFYVPVIPNIDEALDDWFGEHQNYGFEPFSLVTPRPIGHYTQMVWAESTHVGCGISQKKVDGLTTTLFVCNYAPTGNFLGQVPYYSNGISGYLRCVNGTCRRPYGYYC